MQKGSLCYVTIFPHLCHLFEAAFNLNVNLHNNVNCLKPSAEAGKAFQNLLDNRFPDKATQCFKLFTVLQITPSLYQSQHPSEGSSNAIT